MIKKTIIGVVLFFFFTIIVVIVGLTLITKYKEVNYYKNTNVSGSLEEKYTAIGIDKVSYKEFDMKDDIMNKVAIWYPEKLEQSNDIYPVVIFANGTGSTSSTYKSFLTHLASWGFIAVGNDDKNTKTGDSLDKTINFLIEENNNLNSPFYKKIDLDNLGLGGHSQGGAAVYNMAGKQKNKNKIKAIYTVSATSSYHTNIFKDGWEYDLSIVSVPTFMTAGTGTFDSGTANSKDENSDEKSGIMQGITPLWSLEENYNNLPDNVDKIYARKKDVDHGDSYLQMDGYMTAWFMYWLKGDKEAEKVFKGSEAEIKHNPLYQDVWSNIE